MKRAKVWGRVQGPTMCLEVRTADARTSNETAEMKRICASSVVIILIII
jgi:hypothetical protein